MSRHLRFALLALLVVVFAFFGHSVVLAGTISVPFEQGVVKLLSEPDGSVRFEGEKLQFPGQVGEPCIPYRVLKILLPPEAQLDTLSVSLDSVVESDLPGLGDVEPVKPMATWDGEKVVVAWPEGRTIEDGRDVDIYEKDVLFPENRTLEVRTGEIRGWKVVDVPVALFRYNPVTRKLVQLESAEVVVEFQDMLSNSATGGSSDPLVQDMVSGSVVNFDQVAPSYTGKFGTAPQAEQSELPGYVIITTEAISASSDSLDEFATHKGSLGFDVNIFTEAEWGGGSGDIAAENLRNWLKDNYQALNLKYVLLVGNPHPESGDVPMKMLWPMKNNANYGEDYPESPSDIYYADLTGNWDLDADGYYGEWEDDFGEGGIDLNWEVVVGRIPFYGASADLDSILAKTIRYETADPSGTEWRQNVLLPMEPSDSSTPGYHLGEAIKDDVLWPMGYNSCRIYDEEYDLDPAPDYTPCNMDNVTTAWTENNFGLVAWWTHGSPIVAADIMDVDHVTSLDDQNPSFVFQCSCLNAYPEVSNNLSYSLLKNGAVVTVGATRVSWYWVGQTDYAGTSSNSGMTYGYSKNLLLNSMDAGNALASLKQESYATSEYFWMNFTDFNIFGDPSLKMDVPESSNPSVTVEIDGPSDARWLVNRQGSYESGVVIKPSPGTVFEISFSDVDGWIKPDVAEVTVLSEDICLSYTYQERSLDGPTFVKPGGGGDGSSWDSPIDLSEALRDAMSGETILVAEGIYTPKYDTSNNPTLEGQEEEATFAIIHDITLMGGFPDDLAGTASDDRDPALYRTVLTGDLDGDDQTDGFGVVTASDDIQGENAYHVLSCSGVSDLVLDGITVTGGYAFGPDSVNQVGAGLIGEGNDLTVNSCVFSGNYSSLKGGGMYLQSFTLAMHNSTVKNNTSKWGGGAYLFSCQADLEGCTFSDNCAGSSGGGFVNSSGECSFSNSTFYNNRSGFDGAAYTGWSSTEQLTNCTITTNSTEDEGRSACYLGDTALVRNSIFWNETDMEICGVDLDLDLEYSIVRGGLEAQFLEGVVYSDHVVSADPYLGPLTDNGGPTLTCFPLYGSSALDSGTSSGAPSVDQRGEARPQGEAYDCGACEVNPGTVVVYLEGPEDARWSLNGSGCYRNGYGVNGLPPGLYTVNFTDCDDWNTPESAVFEISEGLAVSMRASYVLDVEEPSSWSSVEAGENVLLEWVPFNGLSDPQYEVYMEEDGSFVQVSADRVDGTSVTLDLNGHTEYTLRVDADGFQGQIWSFVTENRSPRLVRRSPGNGATGLPVNTALSWLYVDPDGDSVDYEVFMTEKDNLSLVYSGGNTSFSPELSSDGACIWQIKACDRFEGMEAFEPGVTTGDEWTFSVNEGIYRLTEPVSDDMLSGTGISDIWVASLESSDLTAVEEELGEPVITCESSESPRVSSVDISPDELEETGAPIDRVLDSGFNFALSVSEDVNLVAVPVSLVLSGSQLENYTPGDDLLDYVHLFVLAGGEIFDLVSLVGEERDHFFHVYSDSDESGLIYFVDFRIYLAGGGTALQKQAAAPSSGSGKMTLVSSVNEPSFLLEGARSGDNFQFSLTEAVMTPENTEITSGGGGGGCSALGFASGAGLLILPLLMLLKK